MGIHTQNNWAPHRIGYNVDQRAFGGRKLTLFLSFMSQKLQFQSCLLSLNIFEQSSARAIYYNTSQARYKVKHSGKYCTREPRSDRKAPADGRRQNLR